MMMRKHFLVLALSAALAIAAFAAPGNGKQPAQPITVGEFAVMISQAIGAPATSPQTAVANLQARGLNTPLDLSARLTERQVISMFHDLGVVNIRSSNPADRVSNERAESILGTINLNSIAAFPNPPPPEELPTQCLSSFNRGTCVECCKAAIGSVPNPEPNPDDPDGDLTIDPGRICAKFCKAVLPPGQSSPSEPMP